MGRYLLAVTPLPGHVMPMLRIGQDLVRRGHRVRMLTAARFADTVQAAGMRFVPLPPDGMTDGQPTVVTLDRPPVPRTARRWLRGRAELRSLFITPLAAQYQALAAALAGATMPDTTLAGTVAAGPPAEGPPAAATSAAAAANADAVLADIGFTGVLPLLLAAGPRPPILVCNMSPLMLSSRDTAPFGMARQPARAPVDYRPMTWVVHQLLFRGPQAGASRVLRDLGTGPMPVFLSDWPRLADRLLQLSVPALEYPRSDLPGTVVFTGPVRPASPPAPALPEWWPELAAAGKVVHVTQGTWDNADLGRLVGPAMRGLAGDDVLIVVTTGGRPVSAVPGPVPANARVAEFLPYDALLPLVDVMITNGGYGGVQHALAHGVPLVVAGEGADKPEVAARVAYNGSGIDLHTGTPAPDAIAAAVRTVLADDEYRRQASRLRRDITATRPLDTIAAVMTNLGNRQVHNQDAPP